MTDFKALAAFIARETATAPERLLLNRSKWPDIDMDVVVNTLQGAPRMRRKVPSWFASEAQSSGLIFPTALCTQQCSGQSAALYKARLAYTIASSKGSPSPVTSSNPLFVTSSNPLFVTSSEVERSQIPQRSAPSEHVRFAHPSHFVIAGCDRQSPCGPLPFMRPWAVIQFGWSTPLEFPSCTIADLTGGLGVDSWAFAGCFKQVLYNEANSLLAAAAKHNFEVLGLSNITVSSKLLEPGQVQTILEGFKPDIIFLDPARRSAEGRKVFLLEDCQPDVLTLKEELFEACPNLLLKLSPMADITMLLQRLGNVREVHVVAFDGECKELLLWLQRGWNAPATLIVHEDGHTIVQPANISNPFSFDTEYKEVSIDTETLTGNILFEPGKALLKAGLFNYPCAAGYTKLARHTHLYLAPQNYPDKPLPGKYFKIEKVLPASSKTFKEIARTGIAAEVSTHNLPIKAEDLRARLHATPSSSHHLFAAHTPTSDLLFLTTRLSR